MDLSCRAFSDCSSCVRPHVLNLDCFWCEDLGLCLNATTVSATSICPFALSNECSSALLTTKKKHHSVFTSGLFENEGVNLAEESLSSLSSSTSGVLSAATGRSNDILDGFFYDQYYNQQQWVFEMINLGPVWEQGLFGDGVRVRVNDDGMDGDNVEFAGRYSYEASCDNEEEYLAGSSRQHGTSVASILGAAGGNEACAVGVAPLVQLSSCYALQPNESFLQAKLDQMDISSNSYERPACRADDPQGRNLLENEKYGLRGMQESTCPFSITPADSTYDPCVQCDFSSPDLSGAHGSNPSSECVTAIVGFCGNFFEEEVECQLFLDLIIGGRCSYVGLSTFARASIVKGIKEGRGGLGIVYLFASGNGYHEGDVSTIKGYTNSRLVISVGAVGKDGMHAMYSTPGSSVFITAPGADSEDSDKHYTAKVGGGCVDAGMGTSFSTPVVSGVVALMLEVNPGLGWRDVQEILAATSQRVQDPDDDTATTNGAGYWHSNFYGFGIVDAYAAVERSKTWQNLGSEQLITMDSGIVDLPIADNPSVQTTSTILVSPAATATNVERQIPGDFVVEAVELLLDIAHFSRGDLKVTLTSPSGTKSVLHPGRMPENSQLGEDEFWKLLTVRNWGESPFGEWSLTLTDERSGHLEECVDDGNFFFYYGSTAVFCEYLERQKICLDGGYNQAFFDSGNYEPLKERTDTNGKTMTESCCVCGGGFGRQTFEDKLRHWTIAVYGRRADGSTASSSSNSSAPSDSPTDADRSRMASVSPSPSRVPTAASSDVASDSPSTKPSFSPTRLASTSPTVMISAAPSREPSLPPVTTSPTAEPTLAPTTTSPSFQPTPAPETQHPSAAPSIPTMIPPSTNAEEYDLPTYFGSGSTPTSRPSMSNTPSMAPTENDDTTMPSPSPTSLSELQDADGKGSQGASANVNSGNGRESAGGPVEAPSTDTRVPSPTNSFDAVDVVTVVDQTGAGSSSSHLHIPTQFGKTMGIVLSAAVALVALF